MLTLVNGTTEFPRAAPRDVQDPAFVRKTWRYMIPQGVGWRLVLEKRYWTVADVLARLNPGDRIECYTSDYATSFELLVTEVVPMAEHVRFQARPLWPADLELPTPAAVAEPRYTIRQEQGSDRTWQVVDRSTGMVLKGRLSRYAADLEAQTRNEANASAEALVAKSEARAAAVAAVAPVGGSSAVTPVDSAEVAETAPADAAVDRGSMAEALAALGRTEPGRSPHASSDEPEEPPKAKKAKGAL